MPEARLQRTRDAYCPRPAVSLAAIDRMIADAERDKAAGIDRGPMHAPLWLMRQVRDDIANYQRVGDDTV